MDDGSTDATPELVRGVSGRPRSLPAARPHGASLRVSNAGAARGARAARGHPGRRRLVRAEPARAPARRARRRPGCGGRRLPDARSGRGRAATRPAYVVRRAATCEPVLMRFNPIPNSCACLRRDAVLAVGGYDPRYLYATEWDLWLRLAESHRIVAHRRAAGHAGDVGAQRGSPARARADRRDAQPAGRGAAAATLAARRSRVAARSDLLPHADPAQAGSAPPARAGAVRVTAAAELPPACPEPSASREKLSRTRSRAAAPRLWRSSGSSASVSSAPVRAADLPKRHHDPGVAHSLGVAHAVGDHHRKTAPHRLEHRE